MMHRVLFRPLPDRDRLCSGDNCNCRGFSLIELLIVMGIIATLAAIAVPTYMGFIYRAKVIKAVADVDGIGKAIQGVGIDSGIYPMSLADVAGEDFSEVLDPWGKSLPIPERRAGRGKGEKGPVSSSY